MMHREALEKSVSKMLNNRHHPWSYHDVFEQKMTTESRVQVLMLRFGWSKYQASEVIRLKNEFLADDGNLW